MRVVRFTRSGPLPTPSSCWPSRKAAESDAERDLDYREAQVLKLLLKRVIRLDRRGAARPLAPEQLLAREQPLARCGGVGRRLMRPTARSRGNEAIVRSQRSQWTIPDDRTTKTRRSSDGGRHHESRV